MQNMFDRANRPQFLAFTTTITEMKTPFLFPFSLCSLSFRRIHTPAYAHKCTHIRTDTHTHTHTFFLYPQEKARHSTSPWSVWNYRKFSIYQSISVVYTCICVYTIVSYVRVYLFACVVLPAIICIWHIYNNNNTLLISSTIRLNSRMYTFNIYIYNSKKSL